jgi:2-keto-4-pentenoate hydratase/2-oxohepta-3-ene-1,7-dioic acid hydratase in catechol pathway
MKLISYLGSAPGISTGAVVEDRVIDLNAAISELSLPSDRVKALLARGMTPPADGILRLLHAGSEGLDAVQRAVRARLSGDRPSSCERLTDVRLLAPIPRPGKIVAVGRNYADHAKETGVDPFEKPRIIAKLPSSVAAPGATVMRPDGVTKLDFEAELAVVIGEFARNVPRAQALAAVAGYSVLNDFSAREFQFDVSPPQTTFAKSMDGFCPLGPWLVTQDEAPDPQALELSCYVNGERMQHGRTADMIFPVDRLIEYVSHYMTLEPGDVLATGTPAGVGAFRKPPVWLAPGDRVRIEISRIGVLENEVG